ncbi:basic amino acid ABC transporter substrate-binding protein [Neisseriaceae bacterium JH1-16]|nr:basic amino acid ABC transporter substrate-binding protein [Neisseriaceae bacterium JH1-16]
MLNPSRRVLLSGLLLIAVTVTGCGKKQEGPDAAGASAPLANTGGKAYLVGTDAAYPPFEYQNGKNEVVGFTVDILNAVAAKGGFKVRYLNTPWEGIFATLQEGDRDIIASSVTITDERKEDMDFSEPYFEASQLIIVGKQRADIKALPDLKDLRVAVQTGTTGDEAVQQHLGKTNPRIKRFDSMPQALKALESGSVDAVVGDNGVVQNYMKGHAASFATVNDPQNFHPEFYGFAVKKGNQALLDKIDKGLEAIKADGSYDRIYRKYFGTGKQPNAG